MPITKKLVMLPHAKYLKEGVNEVSHMPYENALNNFSRNGFNIQLKVAAFNIIA